jgi:hypothetical protein
MLELEGYAVIDIAADVFFVGQKLVDDAAGPGPAEVGEYALLVEPARDGCLVMALLDEGAVDV